MVENFRFANWVFLLGLAALMALGLASVGEGGDLFNLVNRSSIKLGLVNQEVATVDRLTNQHVTYFRLVERERWVVDRSTNVERWIVDEPVKIESWRQRDIVGQFPTVVGRDVGRSSFKAACVRQADVSVGQNAKSFPSMERQ